MNTGGILRSVSKGALAAALVTAVAVPCLAQSADNPANWPVYNRSLDGHRFSPLKEITPANVQNLTAAWIHQPGAITQGLVETPLVVDGVVYSIASGDRVFALDGTTGKEIWH